MTAPVIADTTVWSNFAHVEERFPNTGYFLPAS